MELRPEPFSSETTLSSQYATIPDSLVADIPYLPFLFQPTRTDTLRPCHHLISISFSIFLSLFRLSRCLSVLSSSLTSVPLRIPSFLSILLHLPPLLFFCFFSRAPSLSLVHSLSLSHHTSSCHRRCLWQRVKPILQSCLTVICRCDLALFCIGRIY